MNRRIDLALAFMLGALSQGCGVPTVGDIESTGAAVTGQCGAEGRAALNWEAANLHNGVGYGCWNDLCGSFVYQATQAAGNVPVPAWDHANTAEDMRQQSISAGVFTSWDGSCPCGAVLFYQANSNNSWFGHVVLCDGDGNASSSGWPDATGNPCVFNGSTSVPISCTAALRRRPWAGSRSWR
jgi:hypothetical protein